MRNSHMRGFTLLEVLVALTITGLALGSLFALIGGNKRLAWRSEAALVRATEVRSLINQAQLDDMRGELPLARKLSGFQLDAAIDIEKPEDIEPQGTTQALRGYELRDADGELVVSGTYWVELDLPE